MWSTIGSFLGNAIKGIIPSTLGNILKGGGTTLGQTKEGFLGEMGRNLMRRGSSFVENVGRGENVLDSFLDAGKKFLGDTAVGLGKRLNDEPIESVMESASAPDKSMGQTVRESILDED